MIFADGTCKKCGNMCGNGGGDRLRCSCGWESEPLVLDFPDPIKTPIGEWLKAYRRENRITVKAACDAMGVSPSAVSAVEHRGRKPDMGELYKLNQAFDTPSSTVVEMLAAYAATDNVTASAI